MKKMPASVKITISSLNQEQIFDKLIKKNIEITNLKRKNNFESSFFVESKNYKETVSLLNSFNAKICEEKHFGLSLIKRSFFKRIGIFVASLFVLIFFVVIPNSFVLETKIIGNNFINNSEICEFLKKRYNIDNFSFKNSINTSQLELDLLNNFQEISMANVAIKGSTLIVNIKEKSEAEILSLTSENLNIVSNFNGRILELSLVSGTAKVSVGDIVKVGDILVENTQDNVEGNVTAKAKITAEVWLENSYTHNPCEIVTTRTGNTQRQSVVSFFGIDVYKNMTTCKFEKFDKKVSTSKLKNTILPLKVETTTFYEVEEREVKSNYEDNRDKILAQCKQNALQDLLQNDIIKDEKVIENTVGELTTMTYIVVVERHLG